MEHRRAPRIDSTPDCEAVCSRAAVNWTLPLPLLLFAGVVALLPLVAIVRRPTSAPRLIAEACVTAIAVTALVWLAWATLQLLEQRW